MPNTTEPPPNPSEPAQYRTLIVTGISRSGTSLFSALLNKLPEVVSFNEVLPLQREALVERLPKLRRQILKGRPVWNKFHSQGLALDTLKGHVEKRKEPIERPLPADFWLASNRNLTYLNQLPEFVEEEWRVIALVRDPLYTIASWNSPPAIRAEIPCALTAWPEIHPHLRPVSITAQDALAGQAQVWEHYARLIQTYAGRIHIVPFEHLIERPNVVFANIAAWLGCAPPRDATWDAIRPNRNAASRYDTVDLEAIQQNIAVHCPSRAFFGY